MDKKKLDQLNDKLSLLCKLTQMRREELGKEKGDIALYDDREYLMLVDIQNRTFYAIKDLELKIANNK